jgi:hypothetical protein
MGGHWLTRKETLLRERKEKVKVEKEGMVPVVKEQQEAEVEKEAVQSLPALVALLAVLAGKALVMEVLWVQEEVHPQEIWKVERI